MIMKVIMSMNVAIKGNDWNGETYIDKFRVYCVEFYPETKYDAIEKTNFKYL